MTQAELMINDEAYYISFENNEEFIQKCDDIITEIADTGMEGAIIISVTDNGKYTGERYIWDGYLFNSYIKGKIDSTKLLKFMKEQYESKVKNVPPTFKETILNRYCEKFLPADPDTVTIRKTSEDIVMDLRPMAEFTTNEIAKHLTGLSYQIGFDDSVPVWLMRT
jgi:hypothetical protein